MAETAKISDGAVTSEVSSQLHDVLPFAIGDRIFAVFTDQVDATAEAKPFARLPRTPAAIVGVVCVRGRMLTVLDPAAALNRFTKEWQQPLPYVLVMRGDDQLGLAAESCRDTITISAEDIDRSGVAEESSVGIVRFGGEEILVLDVGRLFTRTVERRERRRRRF
jgi:purine-binding chemotaxis protein CheW